MAGNFYKTVVQSVPIYGAETWGMSSSILKALEGFHHQVARRLTHQTILLNTDTGNWLYTSQQKWPWNSWSTPHSRLSFGDTSRKTDQTQR
jgi:hypothetical protein